MEFIQLIISTTGRYFYDTATLTLGESEEAIKVITKIDLSEQQIAKIITAIFQQLPEAADNSAKVFLNFGYYLSG